MNADAILNRILADARESAANAMRDAEARVEKLRAENADALEAVSYTHLDRAVPGGTFAQMGGL